MKPGRIAHWITSARQNSLPSTEQHRLLLPLRGLFEWDFARTKLARLMGARQVSLGCLTGRWRSLQNSGVVRQSFVHRLAPLMVKPVRSAIKTRCDTFQ
jgi:hypothetical protein